ncbi:MAG: hypothetical protein HYX76_15365 [Acidobacteria bacterium]|nr:hypothetical protein [Acidobacteriota bacterium]
MRRPRSLGPAVSSAVLIVAFCGVFAAATQEPTRPATEPPHREWAKDARPAGSKSCEKCHSEHYQRWGDSVHSQMVRLPGPESVIGDFTRDNVLHWKGYTYEMFIKDGKYFMTVQPAKGERTMYPVDFVVGSRRVQGYMTRLPDGRLYLLPAYWLVATQAWFDSSLITPHTDEGVGVKQYWNTNCLACHATDLRFGFDPKTAQYSTKWLELAIGCEACHNPGSKHNEYFEKKSAREYARKEFNETFISNQRYFDYVRSTELCASCHGTKVNYFLGYWPGDRAFDYFSPMLMTIESHDQQGDFYPDGRPTRFNHFMEFMGSKCFLQGKATCISCHEGHSSQNESLLLVPKEESNRLCLNCHQEKYGGTRLTAHTFHLPDSPGSRCYECHMGEVLERLMMHRLDHSLDNPIPENTIRYGIPNTCNKSGCHADKSAQWVIRTLNQWYGPDNREKVLYGTEAMWLARQRDKRAVPLLVRAMKDANLRMTLRASAVSALGKQFGPDATAAVGDLIGMLRSDQPVLRLAAAESLSHIPDTRAVDPIARLLVDPTRVLRITAVAALTNLRVAKLTGPAAEPFERAKQEYLDALKSWPNVPEFRVNLGNYHLLNAKFDQAVEEYLVALQINPELREAWYFIGFAYAMRGEPKKAIGAWKKVREISPGYGNIDRLISLAEQPKPPQ